MSSDASARVVIRTMMGVKNLELSIKCLGSILKFCRHPAEILVHEDGTLHEAARERLVASLKRVRFQNRAEADELMEEKLRAYPRCLAFRRRHIMAMQVLDIPLLTPAGERVIYTDTDILYTRPVECAPFFLGGSLPFTGSKDVRESYAVHLKDWPLLRKFGVRLGSRLCGGMMSFDKEVLDLDHVEWLFKLDEEHRLFAGYPFFVPQTLIAALAARVKSGYVEPRECVVAHQSNLSWARKACIIHFAGFSRNHFDEVYNAIDPAAEQWAPKRLSIAPVPICGLARRVWSAAHSREACVEQSCHQKLTCDVCEFFWSRRFRLFRPPQAAISAPIFCCERCEAWAKSI
jgi:hypothetical protein